MVNGGNVLTLHNAQGHASIQMTMRYAHLVPEHINEAIKYNSLPNL
ncbi:hypothetical protein [Marinobacterium weihaiense]|nr:hypothetical protein [Marinobacterium weihaiense]